MTSDKERDEGKLEFCVELSICVEGESHSPDDVSSILGLSPTYSYRRGEPMRRLPSKVYKMHWWKYASPLKPENSTIEAQFLSLTKTIGKKRNNFAKLPSSMWRGMTCVIYAYAYVPPIVFPSDLCGFVSDMGGELILSLYDLTETED